MELKNRTGSIFRHLIRHDSFRKNVTRVRVKGKRDRRRHRGSCLDQIKQKVHFISYPELKIRELYRDWPLNMKKKNKGTNEKMSHLWSSSPIDICNSREAAPALPTFLLLFEEPCHIAQRKHFQREPASCLVGPRKERT